MKIVVGLGIRASSTKERATTLAGWFWTGSLSAPV